MKNLEEIKHEVDQILQEEGYDITIHVLDDTEMTTVLKSNLKGSISLSAINDLVEMGCLTLEIKRSGEGLRILSVIKK